MAIVPYHPPVINVQQIFVGAVRLVYGPPLPPELAWKRTFQTLLEGGMTFEVQKPLSVKPLSPVILSKRNWVVAFDDIQVLSHIQWKEASSSRPIRPTTRPLLSELESATSDCLEPM